MGVTKNPIRTATIGFVCIYALILVSALSPDIDRKAAYLLFGILYSLFLSYFATGAVLLAKRWQRLLRYSMLFGVVVALGFLSLMIYSLAIAEDGFWFRDNIDFVYDLYRVLIYPTAAIMICVPAFGWIGYFKERRITNASTGHRPSGDASDA